MGSQIWVVSEIYYPEEIGTGYYLTGLAEGLSHSNKVTVLCGYPTYSVRGKTLPPQEVHNNVLIERCRGTTFNKDILPLRLVNLFTICTSIFLKAVFRVKRGDIVLVVTNPPMMPFIIELVCRVRKAKCVLKLDDVYPEILVATGMVNPGNLGVRLLRYMTNRLYRRVDWITTVGRDMAKLAKRKLGGAHDRVTVITNWADINLVFPRNKQENQLIKDLKLENKFVVLCAGNMGRAQGIENMFAAIDLLKNNPNFHFLFIGDGAKKKWMMNEVRKRQLVNVTLLPQRPRSDQLNFLNASDVCIISLLPGVTGAGVPSRMYNAMAAGKPIIAIAEPESELAMVVNEEKIGWVIPPEQPAKLAEVILNLQTQTGCIAQMGIKARAVAEEKYVPHKIINSYIKLIERLG